MLKFRCRGRTSACVALLMLAGCAREGRDEMNWARAALERNGTLEVVAADQQSRTFTVRIKSSGELRMVRVDQLVGSPPSPVGSGSEKAAGSAAPAVSGATPAAPASQSPAAAPPLPAQATAAAAPASQPPPPQPTTQQASLAPQTTAASEAGGRVLESGPGYTIKAVATAPAPGGTRETGISSAPAERRHEAIVCQGARLVHIDNRNLVFDGDAVSAEDGCEIYITNSRIKAAGVGVSARAASVHIDNSLIEGDQASIDASEGAQVYAAFSRFKGLSRRLDTAAFHDLGGNVWN
jgi:hypothetical protein